jgi:hypothetical protein
MIKGLQTVINLINAEEIQLGKHTIGGIKCRRGASIPCMLNDHTCNKPYIEIK